MLPGKKDLLAPVSPWLEGEEWHYVADGLGRRTGASASCPGGAMVTVYREQQLCHCGDQSEEKMPLDATCSKCM